MSKAHVRGERRPRLVFTRRPATRDVIIEGADPIAINSARSAEITRLATITTAARKLGERAFGDPHVSAARLR